MKRDNFNGWISTQSSNAGTHVNPERGCDGANTGQGTAVQQGRIGHGPKLFALLHVAIVVIFWLGLLILQFLGIHLMAFDRPERVKDIEFQLVTAPDEKPRNPRTKNRAEHNTRAGGEKIPNMREAEAQKKAGQAKAQPRPQPQPKVVQTQPKPMSRPQPVVRPQPKQVVTAPPKAQTPTKTPDTAPPRPRVTAPKPVPNRPRIAAVPNPLAPIKVPDSASVVGATGPVVRESGQGSSAGGSTSGDSSARPSTMPGQFSGSGSPGGASGPTGQGGRGSYSQSGSPGGGGGRPGIDAIAEPDFGPYLAELQRRIRRNWAPPEDREDKTVVLLFTIAKDGRLLNITTKRSSGYGNADSAAKMAVERSAPFRPLPAEYRNRSINVEFTFDYNVYTGRSGGISRR